jgi:hypothetical protein
MKYKGLPAIITTLSIAMFAGIVLIPYSAWGIEGAKSAFWSDWCYTSAFPEDRWVCFPNHEECKKAESSDLFKSDYCFKH